MRLITNYPWYFVVLCLVAGVLYSGVLYWIGLRRSTFSPRLKTVLSVLRCIAVSFVAFLLMAPMVRRQTTHREKPIVVVMQDNSRSIDLSKDSLFVHDSLPEALDDLVDALSANYEVHSYSYGSGVQKCERGEPLQYNEQSTNMAASLDDIAERYYRRNIGAVLLTGDGIYNRGENPVSVAEHLHVPVYTVALGDTTVRCDAAVSNVRVNKMAYKGTKFPVEVTVNATNLDGRHATVVLKSDGVTVATKQIEITGSRFSATELFQIDAVSEGVHRYEAIVEPIEGELTTKNNRRVVTVEILDGHRKIAIAAATPHPDVAALSRALESGGNYEVEIVKEGKFDNELGDYDLIVLHQYPNRNIGDNVNIGAILESGVPLMFIVGSGTDLSRLNALHVGLEIRSRIDKHNEVTAEMNKAFTLFTVNEEAGQRFEQFPPMSVPFGEYKTSGSSQTLFYARMGNMNTGIPLVVLSHDGRRRCAFVVGDGLWRWRLADYQMNSTNADFDELMGKLAAFTALRVEKERLHIDAKPVYNSIEDVIMEGQVFNDNYEPVNTAELDMEVRHSDSVGGWHKYLFNKHGQNYVLNMGNMPTGHYVYRAHTLLGGVELRKEGSFGVEEMQLEEMTLVADHALMSTIASVTGGQPVDARNISMLQDLLSQRDDMHTVIYNDTRYGDMLSMPWLLVFIVVLFSIEWVVRKYNGGV